MSRRKNTNPGAMVIAQYIARLPKEARDSIRAARKIALQRQREWLREMEQEFAAAKRDGRQPMGRPCPPSALEMPLPRQSRRS
jgi:hypothetical protein